MKSLHAKLSELLEKMTPQLREKFYKNRRAGSPIETQVNCAEAILRHPNGDTRESAPITKHNGAGDNGRVSEFTESGNGALSVTAKSDEILFKSLGFSEADQRTLKNLPPVGSPTLTASQLREYRWGRSIRLSESDALKLALKVA